MTPLRNGVAALVLAVAVVGCNGEDNGVGEPVTPASSAPSPSTSTSVPGGGGELDRRVAEAKALAMRDHDASSGELVVVRAETVSWPDAAYGCPLTGRTYGPGPFDGYRIVLAHGKRSYTYTGGQDTELKECLFLE